MQHQWLRVILDEEGETFAIELTRPVLADASVLPYPELLPLFQGGVVAVEALAVSAAATSPILEDGATATNGLNEAAPGRFAVGSGDVPLTDPEIKPVTLGIVDANRRRSRASPV